MAWHGRGHTPLGCLSRKMNRVALIGMVIFAVLAIGALLDVNLPSPEERGGAISSREIVARGLAAVSPDLARNVTGSTNVGFYKGTITWRQNWWKAIWQNSTESETNCSSVRATGSPSGTWWNYLNRAGRANTTQHLLLRSWL